MAKSYRCLKCSKIIECNFYDTEVLIKHIKTDHPDIKILEDANVDNEIIEYPQKERSSTRSNNNHDEEILNETKQVLPDIDPHMEEITIRGSDLKPIYTRKYKVYNPILPRSPQKRRMYKISIEKWRHAKGLIFCPKCGANKTPVIKSKTEKMALSTIIAACIFTCWPLCFLPCSFQGLSKEYLYCAECHTFLGMYDRRRNCVTPNRNFVESADYRGQIIEKSVENNPHDGEFKLHTHERKNV